jgi:tetratricopeptide (TPR) repeat protein
MAAKKTMHKKDVFQTDELFSFWERVQAYVGENMRQLAAIGLIICVIVGGVFLWKTNRTKAENESLSLFYRAMNIMDAESKDALDKEVRYGQALAEFKDISRKYSGTAAGASAFFYAGNCSYHLKKYDEAITYYKDFLDKAGSTSNYLKPFAYESIGYAYEEKGQYKEALVWFEKQKNQEQGQTNPAVLLNIARCYEADGSRERACQLYREYIEKHPKASYSDLAKIKIADLCE